MKKADIFASLILVPVDFLMLIAAGLVSYSLRYHTVVTAIRPVFFDYPFTEFIPALLATACLAVAIFSLNGSYTIRSSVRLPEIISRVFQGVSTTILILIVLIFLRRELFSSRFVIIIAWIAATLLVIAGRLLVFGFKRTALSRGYGLHSVIILGERAIDSEFSQYLMTHSSLGYRVTATEERDSADFREKLKRMALHRLVDELLDIRDEIPFSERRQIIDTCHQLNIGYRYRPPLHTAALKHYDIDDIGGYPIIQIKKSSLDGWGRVIKRTLDIVFAVLGLLVTLPISAVIALCILIESRGSVMVRLQRIGRGGRSFQLLKFRSMVRDAHSLKNSLTTFNERSDGPLFKITNDPRITRVGKFLRKASLDELPQLWNVLRGEMSLVGPRPHEPEEVQSYDWQYQTLVAIKPGITGLAQVSGRSRLLFKDEAELDMYYIEHWSVWLDLWIILKTFFVIFRFSDAS